MKSFDCGDADLNDFLLNDAKLFAEKKIANTYILEDKGCIVAYYSLLNDKVLFLFMKRMVLKCF